MVLIIGELCQENVDEIVLTCSALRSLVGSVTRDLQAKVALLFSPTAPRKNETAKAVAS